MKYFFKFVFFIFEWAFKVGLYFIWNFEYKPLHKINEEGIFDFPYNNDDLGPM